MRIIRILHNVGCIGSSSDDRYVSEWGTENGQGLFYRVVCGIVSWAGVAVAFGLCYVGLLQGEVPMEVTDRNIVKTEICRDNTGGYNLFFMLQHNEESFFTYEELKRVVEEMEGEINGMCS